jgi:hypothetical protein
MSTTNGQRTLAQRMTEGRIPVPEALHYAMSLAESLRKLHDAGKAHGAVTPSSINVTATGLELIPSLGPPAAVTPYSAPETLQGQPGDARSDIFSFGALVFEMLTGRHAFEGDGQTALTLALSNNNPPPSGSPAVDRLVNGCVAKNPAARWQRMQKIIMELKLITVAARRADAAPASRVADTALRAEIQQLEARLNARLATHEKAVSQLHESAGDTVSTLREHVAGLATQITALQERPVAPPVDTDGLMQQIHARVEQTIAAVTQKLHETLHQSLEEKVGAVHQSVSGKVDETIQAATQQLSSHTEEKLAGVKEHLLAHVDERVSGASQQFAAQADEKLGVASKQMLDQMDEKLAGVNQQIAAQADEKLASASEQLTSQVGDTVAAVNQRMAAVEQSMDEIRKHFNTLQENVAGDLHDFEQNMKAQGVAIESARTAMAQTDDLVERVVEALELLQSSVLDQHETVVN